MLNTLLKGKTKEAQRKLDELFERIGDRPKLLWYPSSGLDFRDIIEFSPRRMELHGAKVAPNLFIHTDYNCFNDLNLEGDVFDDCRTKVKVVEKHELLISDPDYYLSYNKHVKGKNVNFPEVYLLKISVDSNIYGILEGEVLYFKCENNYFLDSIVLKFNIKISHFLKVREGLGFGGSNGKSISYVCALFSEIGVEYLLMDNEVRIDELLLNEIMLKYGIKPVNYNLEHIGAIKSWSMLRVNVFIPVYTEPPLTKDRLSEIVKEISASR